MNGIHPGYTSVWLSSKHPVACLQLGGQDVHVALKEPNVVGLKEIVVMVADAPTPRPSVEAFYQRSLN